MEPTQDPVVGESQMQPAAAARKPIGPIAGAVIVIALLVAGGLYFWSAQMGTLSGETPYIPDDNYMVPEGSMPGQLESDTSAGLPPQSSSDEVSSIESDFNAMNMEQMESENNAELNNI